METLIGEALAGLEREEPVHPRDLRVALLRAPHAHVAEPVGEPRDGVRVDERPKGLCVVGLEALVRVHREDPRRMEFRRGREETLAVLRVVPA